jgi:hypothetical protein
MDALARFFTGAPPLLVTGRDEWRFAASCPAGALILPGSFNPVHEGHWQLAGAASAVTGRPVAFEISVVNVDKAELDIEEARRRLRQFAGRADVWLTRAARFVDKAELFPGACFVIGADTAARLVSPRYYDDDSGHMAAALEALRRHGSRFLVAGRADPAGRFVTLADLPIPVPCADLFEAIPPSAFRSDLSSSRLRS